MADFRTGSPRFSDQGSPRFSDASTPRFTEHFNASPPYEQYLDNAENAPIPRYDTAGFGSKGQSLSPPVEFIEAAPQSYNHEHEEKEVVPLPYYDTSKPHEEIGESRRRICGLPLLWFTLLIGLVVALAIGLGVGLGVGLTRNKSKTSSPPMDTEYLIGGAISPSYFSKQGAFNGSGLALASQSFAKDLLESPQGSIVMYFQHWTGEIRYMQLSSTSGNWEGGDVSTIVANDAKNGTALSAVSYDYNQTSTWHVFYINQNNTLRQRTNSNATNYWQDGPINQMNIQVLDADMVGMQACWYGNDYGDSDYTHSPVPGNTANATENRNVGMHMWYAVDNTTFQQLGWRAGDETWTYQEKFTNMNAHAGVGCYSWEPDTTVTYVMFVNLAATVEFWWKDTNTSIPSTESHPINTWTNSSIAINNVQPDSSLGYTNAFYAQDASTLLFNGYNISFAAENTSIIESDSFTVSGEPGLAGSHLSVSAVPLPAGGNDLIVFYQTNGSDITEYLRDLVAGPWSMLSLPVPDQ